MEKISFQKVIICLAFAGYISSLNAQITGFYKIKWDHEKIAPGLIWKSSHTVLNDSIPQNINVLIVNLKKRKIAISYDPIQNRTVSKQVTGTDAIAAINGGFFDMRNGGSILH